MTSENIILYLKESEFLDKKNKKQLIEGHSGVRLQPQHFRSSTGLSVTVTGQPGPHSQTLEKQNKTKIGQLQVWNVFEPSHFNSKKARRTADTRPRAPAAAMEGPCQPHSNLRFSVDRTFSRLCRTNKLRSVSLRTVTSNKKHCLACAGPWV